MKNLKSTWLWGLTQEGEGTSVGAAGLPWLKMCTPWPWLRILAPLPTHPQ